MAIAAEAVSRLVGSIYAVTTDPAALPVALGELARLTGVGRASVIDAYPDGNKVFVAATGLDPSAVESYNSHYHRHDRVLPATGPAPVAFTLAAAERLWPGYEKSIFFNEWSRPNRALEIAFVSVALPGEQRSSLVLVGLSDRRQVGSEDQLAVLRLVQPHYLRMISLSERLRRAKRQEEHFFATLERLPYGVVVLDREGGVTHATATARAMLRANNALILTARGLRAQQPEVNAALAAMVLRALGRSRPAALPMAQAVRVPRWGLASPLLLHAIPLGVPGASASWEEDRAVLVLIVDPAWKRPPSQDLLKIAFDLTRTEAAVAILVADGHGLGSVADELGIRLSTVRTHLQRVFQKTGTSRQAELGRMIATVAAGLSESEAIHPA